MNDISLWLFNLAIVVFLLSTIYKTYTKYKNRDIDIPPAAQRKDLLYGYYGCMNDQVSKTSDHVNIHWESQFQGFDKAIENIDEAQKFTVLDVGPVMFIKFLEKGRNYKLNDKPEENLRSLFDLMKAKRTLHLVKAIYPMDEPNINVVDSDELYRAIRIIRKVASEYSELKDVKLVCIYAAKPETYDCVEEFDYVGIDDYEVKSQIFTNGTYENLKKMLRPDQRTIIIPGGAFGQDPTPFLNFANGNPEVGMILAFVWFGPMQAADKWVGIGDDASPLKQRYIDLGKTII